MTNQQSSNSNYNILAIVSLATSLVGFCFVASILGHIAMNQIKQTGEKGKELALAGIIIGYVGTVMVVGVFAFYALLLFGAYGVGYPY